VYGGSDSGEVFALNSTTGAVLWSYQAGDPVRSSPAVLADGSVIVGCYSGDVLHLSASGSLLAKAHTDYSVYAPVSVANGTAFVGSMDKHLYAIDIATFAIKWKVAGANVVNSGTAVSADGSLAYFMDYSGIVHCVATADGTVKWTASTGTNGAGGSSPVLVRPSGACPPAGGSQAPAPRAPLRRTHRPGGATAEPRPLPAATPGPPMTAPSPPSSRLPAPPRPRPSPGGPSPSPLAHHSAAVPRPPTPA